MESKEIKIINLQEIAKLLNDRGITLEDVQEAILSGESTGRKFYRDDDEHRFLVKERIGKFTVYAEYSPNKDAFILQTAYAHRVMIDSDVMIDETKQGGHRAEWICYSCQVGVEEVDNIGLHYNEVELPEIMGYRCPKCKTEMLSENIVMTMLFVAEMMLEAK